MKYYIIKVTSAFADSSVDSVISEKVKTAAVAAGLSLDADSQNKPEDELIKNRKKYLRYNPDKGFLLTSKVTANIFTEESLKEQSLVDFLKDKSYELEETDNENRLLRYRKE